MKFPIKKVLTFLFVFTFFIGYCPKISYGATFTDSYSFSHQNSDAPFSGNGAGGNSGRGQSFTTPNDGNSYKITSAKFYLKGSCTGTINAYLYATTGSYPGSAVPTGSVLGTSDGFTCSSITGTYTQYTFTFTGAEQYTMSPNTHYAVILKDSTSISVNVAQDNASPTAPGDEIDWNNSGDVYRTQTSIGETRDLIYEFNGDTAPGGGGGGGGSSISTTTATSTTEQTQTNIFFAFVVFYFAFGITILTLKKI